MEPASLSSDRPGLSTAVLDGAVELMGRAGRTGHVLVRGTSMRPTLAPGAVLRVDFAPERLRLGDMILIRYEGYLVVHRLVARAGGEGGSRRLWTRGDGRSDLDPAFDSSRVVGRAIGVARPDGWRRLEGSGARVYAWLVAAHDLSWAVAGAAAGWLDRALRRAGLGSWVRPVVRRADRLLLRLFDRLLFEVVHRRLDSPPEEATARENALGNPPGPHPGSSGAD